jgi:hypothetical protein
MTVFVGCYPLALFVKLVESLCCNLVGVVECEEIISLNRAELSRPTPHIEVEVGHARQMGVFGLSLVPKVFFKK